MALVAGAYGMGVKGPIVHQEGNGVASKYGYRNGMGMMSSAEFYVFHDDFFGTVTSNAPVEPHAYTAIIDTGATVVGSTTVGDATGVLYFDSDGGSEGVALYLPKFVQLVSGKRFFMEVRVKTETADDTDVQFGLSDLTATTNPEDLYTTAAANLVSFGVLDGSAVTGMLSDKSNSGTSVQAGSISLVSNTWHTLAIGYDGNTFTGWVDGQKSLTWASAVATTVPTGVLMAPFIAFRNGSAATNEGQFDYLRFVMER